MGRQPGQEIESEPEATRMDVAVDAQAQPMVIAPPQAIGAAETQAQAMVTAAPPPQAQETVHAEPPPQAQATVPTELPPQAIEGVQRDTQASPFSPLCRWT